MLALSVAGREVVRGPGHQDVKPNGYVEPTRCHGAEGPFEQRRREAQLVHVLKTSKSKSPHPTPLVRVQFEAT